MGLFCRKKPKINIRTTKKDDFSGWFKCTQCSELIHENELEKQLNCCPKCSYHYRISASQRINLIIDANTFQKKFTEITPVDPLDFVDTESYLDRLSRSQQKTKMDEAIIVGTGKIGGIETCFGVLNFDFMGGSMGSVVGERLTLLIEYACDQKLPLIMICSSGGARMQESILSLMQMAKTSAALGKLHELSLPYISVLTNPTTGGVTASFASLGDVILAEPDALIGFAGPRVVEQTIRQKLPKGAQRSEFLLEHGMLDAVVSRGELKEFIADWLVFMANGG